MKQGRTLAELGKELERQRKATILTSLMLLCLKKQGFWHSPKSGRSDQLIQKREYPACVWYSLFFCVNENRFHSLIILLLPVLFLLLFLLYRP